MALPSDGSAKGPVADPETVLAADRYSARSTGTGATVAAVGALVAVVIWGESLVAQALAVTVMGEPLTEAMLAGGAAILAGVYYVTR